MKCDKCRGTGLYRGVVCMPVLGFVDLICDKCDGLGCLPGPQEAKKSPCKQCGNTGQVYIGTLPSSEDDAGIPAFQPCEKCGNKPITDQSVISASAISETIQSLIFSIMRTMIIAVEVNAPLPAIHKMLEAGECLERSMLLLTNPSDNSVPDEC